MKAIAIYKFKFKFIPKLQSRITNFFQKFQNLNSMLKTQIILQKKEPVAVQTYFLTFFCKDKIDFKPGQFANFLIPRSENPELNSEENNVKKPEKTWRSYSFAGIENVQNYQNLGDGQLWRFLVSSKMGGVASQLFDKFEVGTEIQAMAPIGRFGLINSEIEKVFVCTGTGLAPFIAMIEESLKLAKTTLFFGTSEDIGDYGRTLCDKFLQNPNFKMYSGMFPNFITTETEFVQNGTVTQLLPKILQNFDQEFYLCGNPFMVNDVEKLLLEKGVQNIVKENFGKVEK